MAGSSRFHNNLEKLLIALIPAFVTIHMACLVLSPPYLESLRNIFLNCSVFMLFVFNESYSHLAAACYKTGSHTCFHFNSLICPSDSPGGPSPRISVV